VSVVSVRIQRRTFC